VKNQVAYARTQWGQLLYDLAFVDLTDKWVARKHRISIGEIRKIRSSSSLQKLRQQVKRDLGKRP
jgi:hypothetical protein